MVAASTTPTGETHELVVVGGGLVGLSLGIAAAQAGLDTLVVDREDPSVMLAESYDGRASAIAYGSQQMLAALGIWAKLASEASPILEIRVADDNAPLFLHYEAQDDFEWQPPYTLPDKIRHMMTAVNNRANYYVFDPLDPKDYADRYAMKAAAYALYTRWNAQYLE